MRKESIDDQCVYSNDDRGRENDIDAQPEYGYALFDGEWIVEGVVFERELLVEGWDLVDDCEGSNEHAVVMAVSEADKGKRSRASSVGCTILHYDEVVDDISTVVSTGTWLEVQVSRYVREDDSLGKALLGEGQPLRQLV